VSTFSWIIAVSLAGGVLSVVAAAAVSATLGAHRVSMLISYAIGALLGASFLEILPHALEHGEPHRMAATVLAGILIFFVLENWSSGAIVTTIIARRTRRRRRRMTMAVRGC
jgi:zinc and cadmium transporter